jgi:hypothetical protein
MNRYADCTDCGGEVVEQIIDYDYRRPNHELRPFPPYHSRQFSCQNSLAL